MQKKYCFECRNIFEMQNIECFCLAMYEQKYCEICGGYEQCDICGTYSHVKCAGKLLKCLLCDKAAHGRCCEFVELCSSTICIMCREKEDEIDEKAARRRKLDAALAKYRITRLNEMHIDYFTYIDRGIGDLTELVELGCRIKFLREYAEECFCPKFQKLSKKRRQKIFDPNDDYICDFPNFWPWMPKEYLCAENYCGICYEKKPRVIRCGTCQFDVCHRCYGRQSCCELCSLEYSRDILPNRNRR